jgi:hypothetical protein
MPLIFREAHAAPDKKRLNEEYFILENTGGTAVSTGGLQVVAARKGKRGSVLGVIDPGFMLQPGEKIIVVSGFPGKKSHGDPPERDGLRVYHLLQREGLLQASGMTIRLTLNQAEIARLEYDSAAPDGVGTTEKPSA